MFIKMFIFIFYDLYTCFFVYTVYIEKKQANALFSLWSLENLK